MTPSTDGEKCIIHTELSKNATGSQLPACYFEKTVDETEGEFSAARKEPPTFHTCIT